MRLNFDLQLRGLDAVVSFRDQANRLGKFAVLIRHRWIGQRFGGNHLYQIKRDDS